MSHNNQHVNPFMPADDAEMRRLRVLGVRPIDMMQSFPGRTYKSINQRMQRLGLCAIKLPGGSRPKRNPPKTPLDPDDADIYADARRVRCARADALFSAAAAGRQFVDHGAVGA